MPSETLLQEYVMMDYGFVYKGHEKFITSSPWNYGQVRLSQEGGLTKDYSKKVRVCSAGPIFRPVKGARKKGRYFSFSVFNILL